jgi:hypothetical protein
MQFQCVVSTQSSEVNEDCHYNFIDLLICFVCAFAVTELAVMCMEMSPHLSSSHHCTAPQNERRFQSVGEMNKISVQKDIIYKESSLSGHTWKPRQNAPSYIGSFKCPGCGNTYRWKQSMMSHYRNECGKEPQFLCPLCPYKCKQKGNLKSHVRVWHPEKLNEIFKLT